MLFPAQGPTATRLVLFNTHDQDTFAFVEHVPESGYGRVCVAHRAPPFGDAAVAAQRAVEQQLTTSLVRQVLLFLVTHTLGGK